MAKPRVIVAPHFRRMDEVFAERDLARLHEVAEVVWGRDGPMPQAEFEKALRDAWAVVFGSWGYGREALAGAGPNLRAILEAGGSHAHPDVDVETCFARGIFFGSCAPAWARPVAEMALGLTLAASREIGIGDRAFRAAREKYLNEGCAGTFMLYGKTVGLVGYGSLARALRPLLAPFGVRFLAYDPWLHESILERDGVEPAGLETIFATSDVIYILAIPSAENRGLVSRRLMERVRPGRVLVLISRAHLVDFDALTDLVLAGRFRAAIDVFPEEPMPPDHPIRRAEHALLSAHRAGPVPEAIYEIGRMVVADLEMILRGLPPYWMQPARPELVGRLAKPKTDK